MTATTPPLRFAIQRACAALESGGVIAYATEAVWGLGCDPFDESAVAHLLQLKQRPESKGLILVAACEQQLDWLLCDLEVEARNRMSASWPGPVTWLVPHRDLVPPWIHGDHDTVAVRVSAHPVVRELSLAFGGPLVSSSANWAGAAAPTQLFQVKRFFGNTLDFIVPGVVGGDKRPSKIIDLASNRAVRS